MYPHINKLPNKCLINFQKLLNVFSKVCFFRGGVRKNDERCLKVLLVSSDALALFSIVVYMALKNNSNEQESTR